MRALKATNQAACERILKKLHYRWWHCAAAPMKRLLSQAGQSQRVIDLVDGVVDTCKVCRTWSKPLPEPVASIHVATTFNQQVEADLMFYRKNIIMHMIDRCTRWHAGGAVPDRKM